MPASGPQTTLHGMISAGLLKKNTRHRRFAMLRLAALLALLLPARGTVAAAGVDTNALLDEVQRAGVRYFYDFGHPVSGLAREGTGRGDDLCATGATGMGLFNFIVGVDRGFLSRTQAVARLQVMLRFLGEKAERYHGVFPHWLNGATGKTIPFSPPDDGADLVETGFLAQGLLAVREYFAGTGEVEAEVRRRADQLWREIEWDWFAKDDAAGARLLWHWSPRHKWKMNLPVRGFNECHIVYLLALGSPTHAVPAKYYWQGWHHARFARDREHFGVRVTLGWGLEMPLFFTQHSYLGFDPRALSYQGRSYFEHFRELCQVQVRYARANGEKFPGYGPLWGLTASYGPDGYRAFAPGTADNGTIAPTAALSSLPYAPAESLAFLEELHRNHRERLWGPYGYVDAFNLARGWTSTKYLGIDVGPIAPMIENHRTGLGWKIFMQAPEIRAAVRLVKESQPGF